MSDHVAEGTAVDLGAAIDNLTQAFNALEGVLRAKLAKALRQRDALYHAAKAAEWGGSTDVAEGGFEDACPVCGEAERTGHQDDCPLQAAIKNVDATS